MKKLTKGLVTKDSNFGPSNLDEFSFLHLRAYDSGKCLCSNWRIWSTCRPMGAIQLEMQKLFHHLHIPPSSIRMLNLLYTNWHWSPVTSRFISQITSLTKTLQYKPQICELDHLSASCRWSLQKQTCPPQKGVITKAWICSWVNSFVKQSTSTKMFCSIPSEKQSST